MSKLFLETSRQLAAMRRYVTAMADMPLVSVLFVTGLATGLAWSAGLMQVLIGTLPGWAHMLVIMPLFGSMIAIYALGGFATLALAVSISADLALAPIREIKSRHDTCAD